MIKSLPNLYSFLHLTRAELNVILDDIGKYYKPVTIPKRKFGEDQIDNKGNIRYRELLVPKGSLKIAQQRINDLLQNIPVPDYMYGSIPGKNHILNAQNHLTQKFFLTIDLKKFFSNITHYQVHQMLHNNGFSYSTSHILTKLTTFQKSLPQGAPSSPVIANLVFLNTAKRLFEFGKSHEITYTNYLDDQSFSSQYSFKHLVPKILEAIREGEFFPSHNKIHYRTRSCEITGLIVKGHLLNLIPKMKKKVETNNFVKAYAKQIQHANIRFRSSTVLGHF
ncbi:RNA-directed DNA polymerase [Panacibacter ginsenosidivorans]|uniref:RNA-directed DNA polymerase n=1 Tax=Panacibacter ginsenosidivorans TaxID=1813871 RepID=A0A5B8VDR7_9BACT|nr:reverse transcriptase family protein [Panacibacter ginsenosidivorans]QEC69614.1 RNA-directed DNA polymerase [Panacibacter ginsenosidivorans]